MEQALMVMIISLTIFFISVVISFERKLDNSEMIIGILTSICIGIGTYLILNLALDRLFISGYIDNTNDYALLLVVITTILPYLSYIQGRKKKESFMFFFNKAWIWQLPLPLIGEMITIYRFFRRNKNLP